MNPIQDGVLVKYVPCHQGKTRSQFVDGGDDPQIRRIKAVPLHAMEAHGGRGGVGPN
jgi:hypothetical protein